MIYRVTVTPAAGLPDAGKEVEAVLLGVGYNPTSNTFQLLLARNKDGAMRMVPHDKITKMTIGPPIVK